MREQLKDLNDYLDLLEARARNKGKQTFTMKEIRQQLGFKIIGTFIFCFFSACAFGQTVTGQAKFNVLAPTIDFIGSIDNTVAYDTNYFASIGGLKWLHFGGSVSNGVTIYGIDCLATNVNMNGIDQITSYGFLAVQTIFYDTHTLTKSDGSIVTTNKSGLDNFFPTKDMGDGDGVLFSDLPGIAYDSTDLTNVVQFSTSESFRTVLMFQPFGGIPVPIKEIDWNWGGVVSLTNSQWVLTSSNAAITINNQATTTFPTWTNVVISSQ
ncbi:MAG: hypothetical protein ACREDS_04885 [Limisphaerales bacterium]